MCCIIQSLLESIQYHPIRAFHLAVGTGMSDGDVPDVNSTVLAVLPELVIVEIRTQVCDDAVREPIAMYDFIQEVEDSISLGTCNRLDLDPLGKLVDSHQNSVESPWRIWERTNHIQPPTSERPSWWYRDELVGRNVLLLGEELASLALLD